jgi:hypothetical protein
LWYACFITSDPLQTFHFLYRLLFHSFTANAFFYCETKRCFSWIDTNVSHSRFYDFHRMITPADVSQSNVLCLNIRRCSGARTCVYTLSVVKFAITSKVHDRACNIFNYEFLDVIQYQLLQGLPVFYLVWFDISPPCFALVNSQYFLTLLHEYKIWNELKNVDSPMVNGQLIRGINLTLC